MGRLRLFEVGVKKFFERVQKMVEAIDRTGLIGPIAASAVCVWWVGVLLWPVAKPTLEGETDWQQKI
jgi:hypothetical protein